MISYIKGTVDSIGENFILLEAMGIGYQVFITKTAISRIKKADEMKIFTYMNIKEDSVALFGFLDKDELEMFNMLYSVPGVGPKMAMSILDTLTPSEVSLAVLTDDYERLSKAPGVGKKTAQMMALRLKDKFGAVKQNVAAAELENSGAKREATEALVSLGYGRSEALRVVLESALTDMTTEQIIRAALRKLSK